MMDVYFNEQSASSGLDLNQLDSLVDKYARVIKAAKSQGFEMVRYEEGVGSIMLNPEYSLAQYLYDHQKSQSAQVLLITQAKPYIPDGDSAVDEYIQNDYVIEVNGEQVKSEGFVAAAINGSMSIGFENSRWNQESYQVREISDGKARNITVLYAFDANFFVSETFQTWADVKLPPTLLSSGLLPNEKNIHVSPHHGSDVLVRFAKRIRREEYVKEILNSIDRDSKQKQFVRAKEGTNLVEITLIKDDYYGLVISTTARNDKELRYIVKLITEKYS